jgi:hypothetical protein
MPGHDQDEVLSTADHLSRTWSLEFSHQPPTWITERRRWQTLLEAGLPVLVNLQARINLWGWILTCHLSRLRL